MALQITFTTKDYVPHVDAYHVVSIGIYDVQSKNLEIRIKAYKDSASKSQEPSSYINLYSIHPNPTDFDSYFSDVELLKDQKSMLKQVYTFLKTIDPDEEGSAYSDFSFDYKNDSTDA